MNAVEIDTYLLSMSHWDTNGETFQCEVPFIMKVNMLPQDNPSYIVVVFSDTSIGYNSIYQQKKAPRGFII